MRYAELHAIVTALKTETAIMRARAMGQHAFDCVVRGDLAIADDDHDAIAIWQRSERFARRRAGALTRELAELQR